ncbi:hypothetical protein ACTFIU_007484 [Dictyostelium citrinum]
MEILDKMDEQMVENSINNNEKALNIVEQVDYQEIFDSNTCNNKRKLSKNFEEEIDGANHHQIINNITNGNGDHQYGNDNGSIKKKQCTLTTTTTTTTTTTNGNYSSGVGYCNRVLSNILTIKILKYSIKLSLIDNTHEAFIETLSLICKSWNLFILPKLNLSRYRFNNDDYLYTYLKVQDMCKGLINRTTPTPEYELAGNQTLEGLFNSLFVSPYSFGVHEFKIGSVPPPQDEQQQQQQEQQEQDQEQNEQDQYDEDNEQQENDFNNENNENNNNNNYNNNNNIDNNNNYNNNIDNNNNNYNNNNYYNNNNNNNNDQDGEQNVQQIQQHQQNGEQQNVQQIQYQQQNGEQQNGEQQNGEQQNEEQQNEEQQNEEQQNEEQQNEEQQQQQQNGENKKESEAPKIDYGVYIDGEDCGTIFKPDIEKILSKSKDFYTTDDNMGTNKGMAIALSRLKIPAFEVYGEKDVIFYKDQVYHSAQTNFKLVLNKMHISMPGKENNLQIQPDNGDLIKSYVGSFLVSLGIDAYSGGEIIITGNGGSFETSNKTSHYRIESVQSFKKRDELMEQIRDLEQYLANIQEESIKNGTSECDHIILQQKSIQSRIRQLELEAQIQIFHFRWVAFYQGCVVQTLQPVTSGCRIILHFNVYFNHLEREEDFKIIKGVDRIRVSSENNYQHPEGENDNQQVKEIINFSNENQFLRLNAYQNRTFNCSKFVLGQVPVILEKIIKLETEKNPSTQINIGIILNNLYKSSNIKNPLHFHQLQDFDHMVLNKLKSHFGDDNVKVCSFLIHFPKPIVPQIDEDDEDAPPPPPQNPEDLKPRIEMINAKIVNGFNRVMKDTKTLLFLSSSKYLDLKSIHSKPIMTNDSQEFEEVGCFSAIMVLSDKNKK